MTSRRAASPGKVILSGEHAVVHGTPALAMAVNLLAEVEWVSRPDHHVELMLPGQPPEIRSLDETFRHLNEVEERHRLFRRGRLEPAAVAPTPSDLLWAAVGKAHPENGGRLSLKSDIPPGSGMGSSAAFLLALFKALRPEWTDEDLYRNALACEHFQHGSSSGLDVAASLRGGCIWMENGESSRVTRAAVDGFSLWQTGQPESTTGECVSAVAAHYPSGHPLWRTFEEVTRRTRTAIESSDSNAWKAAVRENHRLLCNIGVVPQTVQNVVRGWEAAGGAAKLCGAGSVKGDAGGILLAFGPPPADLPSAWTRLHASEASKGTRILPPE